ncbi:MAG: response regulator [Candidatus Bathyarchaeota archaeon]|nr:response regulator [Candidatus Bathyarchaeota archaeon]
MSSCDKKSLTDENKSLIVLHIDDDPTILAISKMILESDNRFQVETATSVQEAFKKLAQQPFQAIISDYEMPKKDGLQFLEELRKQKNEIAFVMFTGRGREEVAVKALNLGADRYINKNGDPETVYCELSYALTKIIERKKARKMLLDDANKIYSLNEKLRVVGGLTRHDVRNKLVALNAHVFMLKKRVNDNSDAAKHISGIELAVKQIVELLEFSRLYEKLGAEELKFVEVEKCINEASRLTDLKDIKLVNQCQGLTVMADSLLRQLFFNLIDNTIKHGKTSNQIQLRIELDEPTLELIYEDNGVGISDEMTKDLFAEKSQSHGLYLARRICEAYGWTISETGKQGQGAQFTINIPKALVKNCVCQKS